MVALSDWAALFQEIAMLSLDHRPRVGFTLIEFLIVFVVDLFIVGLLMSAVQRARDAARRIETVNNLKQIGIGLHVYHDSTNAFPSENASSAEGMANGGKAISFYTDLLPYVEQNSMSLTNPTGIRVFTCPSRRILTVGAPPVADFGYQATTVGNLRIDAVLDSPINAGLGQITNQNGSSNTLMLSIVSDKPSDYANYSLPFSWPAPNHGTKGTAFTKDSEAVTSGVGIGGPYPAIPSLYVDGHVTNIPTPSSSVYPMLWSFSNNMPFAAP
jgi:type II secretory pathway pseudopilin PulG